ncbi:MAG TPA: glycosyltransferase family 9 protein [Vicinamibacterales bacterium]|nr:glycosyltransferase family 9 protein [Vicinamibacterales bacterium]
MLNIERQRWVDRVLGPPLCWLVTLLHRLHGPETAPRDVHRILIIVLSEMGALVLTRPMFDRLREKHPSATFYVLCSGQNRPVLDLLDLVPAERVIILRSGSLAELARDIVGAVRRMRALRLDAVLDLELFARVSAILAGLSGARIRVGFHRFTQEGLYRGDLMNRPVLYNPHQHIAQQFITLAEAVGSTDVPTAKRLVSPIPLRLPPMVLRPDELDTARDALYRRHPSIAGRPLVFLCPGAGLLPIRAWPVASFSVVASDLIGRGYAVAIIGVAADRELAQTIQRACASTACVDLTGYTKAVRDVAVLLHLGVLLITNDGGTGHVASLTPIASIVLFGPETPVLYGSLSARAVNLHKPLSCSPCLTAYNHRRSPCDGNNVCLQSISPEEVLAAANELLRAGGQFHE